MGFGGHLKEISSVIHFIFCILVFFVPPVVPFSAKIHGGNAHVLNIKGDVSPVSPLKYTCAVLHVVRSGTNTLDNQTVGSHTISLTAVCKIQI